MLISYLCIVLIEYCICSDKRDSSEPATCTKQRRKSCPELITNESPLVKAPSLPCLINHWTCIRCLLDNSCRAKPVCTACGASSSISQTQATQVGVRKCRRLNTKNNKLNKDTVGLDLVTRVTSGSVTRILDTNNVKISVGNSNNTIGEKMLIFLTFLIQKVVSVISLKN